jgi:hypothetical protein
MTISNPPPFEEVYETLPSDGWLTRIEAELLWHWVNLTTGPILEVGSYRGRSTCLLGATGRPVYAVDPFDGFDRTQRGDDIARDLVANLESRGLANVVVYRQRVEDWKPQPVGFAYLDGDHTYHGTVAQVRKALLCHPTIITAHDVNDSGGGLEVKQACIDILGKFKQRMERLAVWDRRE